MKKYYIVKELKTNKYIKSLLDCNWDELEYTDNIEEAMFHEGYVFITEYVEKFINKVPDTYKFKLILEIITIYAS